VEEVEQIAVAKMSVAAQLAVVQMSVDAQARLAVEQLDQQTLEIACNDQDQYE
jgi:hypothetical protein